MPATDDKYIWIADAVKEYDRSREWLDKQVSEGKLSVAQIPGDRRLYLVRAELDNLLRPQIVRPAKDSQAG
jgi:hypothetical protein